MKKKYFFGYLFVRFAKLIALLAFLSGCAYAIYLYSLANIRAESVRYRPSRDLDSRLDNLDREIGRAVSIVNKYQASAGKPECKVVRVPLLHGSESESDFRQLQAQLAAAGEIRTNLKSALVEALEQNIGLIQAKLRAHAEAIAAEEARAHPKKEATAAPTPTPVPTPEPAVARVDQIESLFPFNPAQRDVEGRNSKFEKSREYIGSLEAAAENPENKATLKTILGELDSLQKLMPVTLTLQEQAPAPAPMSSAPLNVEKPEPRKTPNAAKVAQNLGLVYSEVRGALLNAWELDDALTDASNVAAGEQEHYRLASLTLRGLWLERLASIGVAFLCATFAAFLLLVLADITQSFLDTASNTGELLKK